MEYRSRVLNCHEILSVKTKHKILDTRTITWYQQVSVYTGLYEMIVGVLTTYIILYVFFWVFPRRLIVVCRRFGTLCQFHLHRLDMKCEVILRTSYPAYEDGTDGVFRNVGIEQSDAGEIPKRIHTRFKTRRKFEIKNLYYDFFWVVPRRLNYICRRFGTLYLFHLHRQVVWSVTGGENSCGICT